MGFVSKFIFEGWTKIVFIKFSSFPKTISRNFVGIHFRQYSDEIPEKCVSLGGWKIVPSTYPRNLPS